MKGNLLIVGGSGFIGRNLAIKSLSHDFNTTVISLTKIDFDKEIPRVNYIQVDITNSNQLRAKLSKKNFHYVINLSGYIDHSTFLNGGAKVISTHFGGVQNLLEVLDWSQLRRFVQIGSSDEYGSVPAPQNEDIRESPISPYSLGKVSSTNLLQMLYRTEKLPIVVLRLFLVYGEGQKNNRLIPQIIKGCLLDEFFPTSKGEQLRDLCHVDDITDGILSVLENDKVNGEIINLASGVPVSIREVIEIIHQYVGSGRPGYGKVPYRNGENMQLFADISKAKRILNWSPKISLLEGIKKTIISINLKK
jgi:nucleoside-diphosphate-sugar epimerase